MNQPVSYSHSPLPHWGELPGAWPEPLHPSGSRRQRQTGGVASRGREDKKRSGIQIPQYGMAKHGLAEHGSAVTRLTGCTQVHSLGSPVGNSAHQLPRCFPLPRFSSRGYGTPGHNVAAHGPSARSPPLMRPDAGLPRPLRSNRACMGAHACMVTRDPLLMRPASGSPRPLRITRESCRACMGSHVCSAP